ncbi:MAG: hypothetical protein DRP42_03395 [Tenericutes bacterium]|nr:MAG: hypothetical protein DRP42_03395 [Mycoplasmatota bacterium]
MNKKIEVRNLKYKIEKKEILKDVSFFINNNEILALVGKNGSGKTTIAKLLSGVIESGDTIVLINGKRLNNSNAVKQIGIVFQNPESQMLFSTVEQELSSSLEFNNEDPALMKDKITSALSTVGLVGFEKRQISSLSGGEKQKVAIATQLIIKTDLLILDEPSSMLDDESTESLFKTLKTLGKPTLLITQSILETLKADRVIVLDKGEIIFSGSPIELVDNQDVFKKTHLAKPYKGETYEN